MNNIEENLINWFSLKTQLSQDEIQNQKDNNYFEMQWIDSFTFLEFIVFLEKTYNISFSNDEFQNKDFANITGLAQIIKGKITK